MNGESYPTSKLRKSAAAPDRSASLSASILASLSLLLSGCLLNVERDSRIRSNGDIADAAFHSALAVGETNKDWLIQRLGHPDALWLDNDGHEVMRYDEYRQNRTEVSALLLVNFDVRTEQINRHYFVLQEGVLIRYWRDNDDQQTLVKPSDAETANESAEPRRAPIPKGSASPHAQG